MFNTLHHKILKLAFPNIVSNICIPLLGVVDVILLSSLDSEKYLGGIAIGAIVFNYLFWGFSFLRMGTSGLAAQALGRRDFYEVYGTLIRSLTVSVLAGLMLILFQSPIKMIAFLFLQGSADVEQIAVSYYNIRIWAAPATLAIYSFSGWFIGMQNSRIPMFVGIFVNLMAVILDFFLIRQMGLKSDAVAWGNVIAQWLGVGLCVLFYCRFYRSHFLKLKIFSWGRFFTRDKLWLFCNLNFDVFIRTLSLIFVFSFFTNKSAQLGDTVLATNYILLQLFYVFSYGMDGFAYAAEALVGKYKGADRSSELRNVVKHIFYWGFLLMILFTSIYAVYYDDLLLFFTERTDILELAKGYYIWVVAIPIVTFAAFIWDGVYTGAMETKYMRNIMMGSVLIFFMPYFLNLHLLLGNQIVWLSFLLFMLSRSVGMTWLSGRLFSKN